MTNFDFSDFCRLKDGKVLRTKNESYENNIAKLILMDTTEKNEGTYTCRAVNEGGSVETNCKVVIQGKLDFKKHLSFWRYKSIRQFQSILNFCNFVKNFLKLRYILEKFLRYFQKCF